METVTATAPVSITLQRHDIKTKILGVVCLFAPNQIWIQDQSSISQWFRGVPRQERIPPGCLPPPTGNDEKALWFCCQVPSSSSSSSSSIEEMTQLVTELDATLSRAAEMKRGSDKLLTQICDGLQKLGVTHIPPVHTLQKKLPRPRETILNTRDIQLQSHVKVRMADVQRRSCLIKVAKFQTILKVVLHGPKDDVWTLMPWAMVWLIDKQGTVERVSEYLVYSQGFWLTAEGVRFLLEHFLTLCHSVALNVEQPFFAAHLATQREEMDRLFLVAPVQIPVGGGGEAGGGGGGGGHKKRKRMEALPLAAAAAAAVDPSLSFLKHQVVANVRSSFVSG